MDIKNTMINVKRIRLAKNWTQKYLADELNVTEATYGRYESGDINVKLEHFIIIADLFEMTLDEIVAFDPETHGKSKKVNYDERMEEIGHKLAMANEREESLKKEVSLLTDFNNTTKDLIKVLKEKKEGK